MHVRHSLGTASRSIVRTTRTVTIRSIIIRRVRDHLLTWTSVMVGMCTTIISMAVCIRIINHVCITMTMSLIRT